jgi:glutamyl-tRNA reductase
MKFTVTGLSHKTAPVEVREKLAFDADVLPGALRSLTARPGLLEAMILSTCNRVEVSLASEENADPELAVDEFFSSTNVDPARFRPYVYHYIGADAIRHLFRVASSLDSMVVGEPQILGQFKAAYALAREHGAASGFLETVMTRAFSVAKRVRTETEIGSSAVSVSFAAVELAREIFGSLKDRTIMIIGAGKMSEAAARHLARNGVTRILVTNRTEERALEMARLFNGAVVPYSEYLAALPEIDIVITSSGAPHYVLTSEHVKRALDKRRNRPVFLIDIGVPRNIEPAVNQLENAFLYDIDDLRGVVERNVENRKQIALEAERIVEEEAARMMERLKVREVAPTILSLQEQLEIVRAGEIARARGRLGTLTKEQEVAIEQITRGIINKIAHGPISELRRNAAQADGVHVISTIRRIFRLGDE